MIVLISLLSLLVSSVSATTAEKKSVSLLFLDQKQQQQKNNNNKSNSNNKNKNSNIMMMIRRSRRRMIIPASSLASSESILNQKQQQRRIPVLLAEQRNQPHQQQQQRPSSLSSTTTRQRFHDSCSGMLEVSIKRTSTGIKQQFAFVTTNPPQQRQELHHQQLQTRQTQREQPGRGFRMLLLGRPSSSPPYGVRTDPFSRRMTSTSTKTTSIASSADTTDTTASTAAAVDAETEDETTAAAAAGDGNNRLPRQDLSLELRTIINHLPIVESHLISRRASEETILATRKIASLADERIRLMKERDAFLNKRKEASAIVGRLMSKLRKDGNDDDNIDETMQIELDDAREASTRATEGADKAVKQLDELQPTIDDLLAGIPNLLDDRVPDGDDDTENEEVYKWGDVASLPAKLGWTKSFQPLWHDDVASGLDGYMAEEAVKMSGTRFVALSGSVARLERALAMFFMDLHTSAQHGYREVTVPYVVSRSSLMGTSQLPKFQEDLFAITSDSHTCNGEDAFLIPTAEVPVTNIHRGQVLDESDLPISYVAHTPCFRAEAGSYGRDTKGLIRTHQFHKVELVKITSSDTSDDEHEALTMHAEACLRALELPYRKVRLCSGDIGFSARHCYDLEVWLPGAAEYREISSCSNTGDFQARRMGLRYRPKVTAPPEAEKESADDAKKQNKAKKKKATKPKPQLCHTINGSGLAVGRALVAVLENYQRPDRSVVIPDVLRPYMGGLEVIERSSKK